MKRVKGQVTIFVILAVALIVLAILFFYFRIDVKDYGNLGERRNVELFLQDCLDERVLESSEIISQRGGSIEPRPNLVFDGETRGYTCYTSSYYSYCVNQFPVLVTHIEQEIHSYVESEVSNCLADLQRNMEEQSFSTDYNLNQFKVSLLQEKIVLDLDTEISVNRGEENYNYNDLTLVFNNYLYELVEVVQEINMNEGESCDFDWVGYQTLYPEFSIDKFVKGTGEEIYTIVHRNSEQEFIFAVRGCILPPGNF